MGSPYKHPPVTLGEAAKMLGIGAESARVLLKKEGITPVAPPRKYRYSRKLLYFEHKKIEALIRKRLDEASEEQDQLIYEMKAKCALLEQRLELLEYMFGLRIEKLPLDKEDMETRYRSALGIINTSTLDITETKILEWSRYLFAVTEEYFQLMEKTLGVPNPWMKFVMLANRVAVALFNEPPHTPSVAAAQEYFDVGRKNLRTVAYACAARKYGVHGALELVPLAREGDVDEEIIATVLSREVFQL